MLKAYSHFLAITIWESFYQKQNSQKLKILMGDKKLEKVFFLQLEILSLKSASIPNNLIIKWFFLHLPSIKAGSQKCYIRVARKLKSSFT